MGKYIPSRTLFLLYYDRMVPQDNDTGGFFIACLRKVKEYPVKENDRGSKRKTSPIVTAKADHHQLYEMKQNRSESDKYDGLRKFSRSQSSSSRTFHVTESLATYLQDCPGSKKLNLVYTGCDNC